MEIERKFLVISDAWKQHTTGEPIPIEQHYFAADTHDHVTAQLLRRDTTGEHYLMLHRPASNKRVMLVVPQNTLEKLSTQELQALFGSDGQMTMSRTHTGRVRQAGDDYYITFKCDGPSATERPELEWQITPNMAQQLIRTHTTGSVCKQRYHVPAGGGLTWEVDVFGGDNAPLVTTEIELPHADASFVKPSWLGADVSALGRYSNAALAQRPYGRWSDAERAAPAITPQRN